jgi:phosphoribosylaminoimidazole (AIR) synthetase
MSEIVTRGALGFDERYRTFNMGVGYTLILDVKDVAAALAAVPAARVVGFVQPRADGAPRVIVHPRRA